MTRRTSPGVIVDRISSRPILLITSTTTACAQGGSEQLYAHAKEPKKLVVFQGEGHYEVYAALAFTQS